MKVAWVAVAIMCVQAPASAASYTLPDLITRVERQYPGVVAARAGVAAAQAQLDEANYLWAPSGEITFGLTGSPNVRCADANGYSSPDKATREANCITTDTVTVSRANNFLSVLPIHGVALNLSAKLVQPLYTFGKIEAARAAAKAGLRVAEDQVAMARDEVVLNAVRAYYGLKWARTSEATLLDGRDRVKSWVDKISGELDKGKGTWTETDLLRLKLALDQLELSVFEIQRAVSIAQSALRTLTQDPQADIDSTDLTETEVSDRPLSFYEDAARTHRPEARMLDSAMVATGALRRLRIAQFLPDLAVISSFGYGYAQAVDDPKNAFMNHPNGISAGLYLGARIPLDVGGSIARLRRSTADQKLMDARRREALGGIALEIERAYAVSIEARKRSQMTGHGEKIARGWYNAIDQNMQLGTAQAREIVDAARAYFEMRLGHLRAVMDANVTLATLRRTAGVL